MRIRGKHDDIDLIGRTTRHLTFFEMLGNFSFGDYFKERAIPLAWEFLTGSLGLDGDRLWISVFLDDDEAAEIWADQVGVPAGRIQRMGDDNFWEMGETGPCGPCSEIYYDRGPGLGAGRAARPGAAEKSATSSCGTWSSCSTTGSPTPPSSPCPSPNIDTGAGLERVLTIVQDVPVHLGDRPPAPDHRPGRGAHRADLRRGRRGRRGAADPGRSRPVAVVPDQRRRVPEQRGPRLRAASPHPPGRAPGLPARRGAAGHARRWSPPWWA